jgi:hypothetical protein
MKSLRGPLDQRRLASLQRTLLRAGFSGDTIRTELRALTRTAKAAAAAAGADETIDAVNVLDDPIPPED